MTTAQAQTFIVTGIPANDPDYTPPAVSAAA